MALCGTPGCACGIVSSSLQISGSGQAGDPYVLESTGLTVVTSATRPGTPFLGQQIVETDTGRLYWWNGSAWKLTRDPVNPATAEYTNPADTTSTATTTMTTWITLGNVVVPPWAKDVVVHGVQSIVGTSSAAENVFYFRWGLGGVYGPQRYGLSGAPSRPWTYLGRINSVPTGSQPLVIQARRQTAGADQARMVAGSTIAATVTFLEQYP